MSLASLDFSVAVVAAQAPTFDLADLQAKRPPVNRAGLLGRVRSLMRSAASKRVARAYCRGLKKVCREIVASGGVASSG